MQIRINVITGEQEVVDANPAPSFEVTDNSEDIKVKEAMELAELLDIPVNEAQVRARYKDKVQNRDRAI